MQFYEQITLILFFIVITQIILCIFLIMNYTKLSGSKLGPKLGAFVDKNEFEFIENGVYENRVIIFVDIGCSTCEKVITTLQKKETKLKNIYVVANEREEEVDSWKKERQLLLDIHSLKNDNIEKKYNIKSFPYYIKINDNKVFEKGFLNEINILKLYEEVE